MSDLVRYGLRWTSPTDFVCEEMADGYWTPWHWAKATVDDLKRWKDALQEAGVIDWCLTKENEDDPCKLLADIVSYNVQIALDPAVSSDAQALIDKGKAESEEEIRKLKATVSHLTQSLALIRDSTFNTAVALRAKAHLALEHPLAKT